MADHFERVKEYILDLGFSIDDEIAEEEIVVINDEERGLKVKLKMEEGDSEILMGRESDCQVVLSHWSVSRHHARIVRTSTGVTIEDPETNTTFRELDLLTAVGRVLGK